MSTAAGGEVIGGLALGAATAVGAACVAAGGLLLATGYLVCKGGYRAVKTCKKAIQDHQQKLKNEREARLRALQEADEAQANRLNAIFREWAGQARQALEQKEAAVRQEMKRQQAAVLDAEQKAAAAAAAEQKLRQVEQELANARGHCPLIKGEGNKEQYKEFLQREQAKLDELLTDLRTSVDITALYSVTMPAPPQKAAVAPEAEKFWQRLAACRAGAAMLLSAPAATMAEATSQIAGIEELLEKFEIDAGLIEKRLGALEKFCQDLQKREQQWRQVRHKVWEEYWNLQELKATIEADDILTAGLADSLTEAAEVLKAAKEILAQPGSDPVPQAEVLVVMRVKLKQRLDAVLLAHQEGINQGIQGALETVLAELGYTDRQIKVQEGTIVVSGTGTKDHPEAELQFFLSPEGYLNVDLSGRGFGSQKACTKEFNRVQAKLLEHDIQVELKKHKTTWLDYMKDLLLREFQEIVPDQEIQVTRNSNFLRLETTGRSANNIIEVNGDTGEITRAEGEAAVKLAQAAAPVEKIEVNEQTTKKLISRAKKKITVKN